MNDNIHSRIKTMTDSITDILQKLTDEISNTEKHGKKLTEISSKISNHEDRL